MMKAGGVHEPIRMIRNRRSACGLYSAETKLDVQFDSIRAGILTGSLTGKGSENLDEVLVAVGRQPLDFVPLSSRGRESEKTFSFDLRSLPPALLLEDRLSIEIRPKQQPTRLLAAIEIAPEHILSLGQLAAGRGRLEGYIDAADSDVVRGWVWDPRTKERRIRLHLFIDGRFHGVFEASSARPDLEASGRGDGCYGFVIPTKAFFDCARSKWPRIDLVSTEPEFWRVPLAPHLEPSQSNFTRFGLSPRTVREVVALLAGNAPLPKKVFAIDRATQTPDAFSADYLLLGLEFLRTELIRTIESPPAALRDRLLNPFRQNLIQRQIRRLTSLVDANAASQQIVERTSKAAFSIRPSKDA